MINRSQELEFAAAAATCTPAVYVLLKTLQDVSDRHTIVETGNDCTKSS